MQLFKTILLVLASMIVGGLVLTWMMLVIHGMRAGLDVQSAIKITPLLEMDTYDSESLIRFYAVLGSVLGVLVGVLVYFTFVVLPSGLGSNSSSHTDYVSTGGDSYSGSDSGSDGGFSD